MRPLKFHHSISNLRGSSYTSSYTSSSTFPTPGNRFSFSSLRCSTPLAHKGKDQKNPLLWNKGGLCIRRLISYITGENLVLKKQSFPFSLEVHQTLRFSHCSQNLGQRWGGTTSLEYFTIRRWGRRRWAARPFFLLVLLLREVKTRQKCTAGWGIMGKHTNATWSVLLGSAAPRFCHFYCSI